VTYRKTSYLKMNTLFLPRMKIFSKLWSKRSVREHIEWEQLGVWPKNIEEDIINGTK